MHLRLSILLLASFTFVETAVSESARRHETESWTRGVWLTNVDSDVLFDPHRLEEAINILSKHGFNTLYPVVWNRGHTLYPSQASQRWTGAPQLPRLELAKRDALKEVIGHGQRYDMRVIPWFEYGLMMPADSRLANEHPEWLTRRADGSAIWLLGGKTPMVWLNPLHPQVQAMLSELLSELVDTYAVDGIQLDDHFGYHFQFGYDPRTLELYQRDYPEAEPPPAPDLDQLTNCVHDDPDWQSWVDWRAASITHFVEKLVSTLKAIRPQLTISVSPNPQTFSKNCYLLDWRAWHERGLIDELVLQVYRDNMLSFGQELSKPEVHATRQSIPVVVGILSGLRSRHVSSSLLRQQIDMTRARRFSGVSFFFYESLWNLADETPQERQRLFKEALR
ncbi:MAG: family 10 glycosylhydrolase [Gammaproteobacteria bacterium]|nr:family 10 glycosylhydrolase [Gammaproteobacteria bacterium]MCY4199073.1 family 10 glycosylhydrolase [Gammaproteobacteria bacterium]MCY4278156.1 family 10 glycosylhydrolase [Gammaproteobacteria bacterium]MCY4323771.1 family 10 glycosylhydrolase [Gammaproteobacteria bacterium]